MGRTVTQDHSFPASWRAEVLVATPLIAPARQITLPRPVPGEEDALARGALQLLVKPATGGTFLATCALGFRDPALPSGVWSCPNPDDMLAVAGGYAYLLQPDSPEGAIHLQPRPVVTILSAADAGLLLMAGFHDVTAIGPGGVLWRTRRLSWEGVTLGELRGGVLHGAGWHMQSDREIAFTVDLQTGEHNGGGFP